MRATAATFSGLEDPRTGASAEFFKVNNDPTSSSVINVALDFTPLQRGIASLEHELDIRTCENHESNNPCGGLNGCTHEGGAR